MNTQRHEVPDDPTLVLDAESGKWSRPQSTRAIVYPDGRVVKRLAPIPRNEIEALICDPAPHAPRSLTVVNLRDGHVMFVHDMGAVVEPKLPINRGASAAYLALCKPDTDWLIRGVVVVVPDSDFA